MLKLLLQFWPVLLPLLIYIIWMWQQRRIARREGADIPAFTQGPWGWAVGATLLGIIIALFVLGLSFESNRDAVYSPKQMRDGELVKERLE